MTPLDSLRAGRRDRHAFPKAAAVPAAVCLLIAGVAPPPVSQFFAVLAIVFAVLALAGLMVGYYQEVRCRHASH